jgi:hypothetical protein
MFTRNYDGYAVVIVEPVKNEREYNIMIVSPKGDTRCTTAYTQAGAFDHAHQLVDRMRHQK